MSEAVNERTPQLEFAMKVFDYVFRLPWPATLAKLPPLDDQAEVVLDRFSHQVARLTRSQTFRHRTELSLSWNRESGSSVTSNFPHEENLIGYMTSFRQCYSGTEKFNFLNIINEMNRSLRAQQFDAGWLALLQQYQAANGALQSIDAQTRAYNRMFDEGMGGYPVSGNAPDQQPQDLISTFAYGDWIHADRPVNVERLHEWLGDETTAGLKTMAFLNATAGYVAMYVQFTDSIKVARGA